MEAEHSKEKLLERESSKNGKTKNCFAHPPPSLSPRKEQNKSAKITVKVGKIVQH